MIEERDDDQKVLAIYSVTKKRFDVLKYILKSQGKVNNSDDVINLLIDLYESIEEKKEGKKNGTTFQNNEKTS